MSERYQRKTKRKLYLEITTDKYQLPVLVCDSPGELARCTGKAVNTINSLIWHTMHGDIVHPKYIVVELDDEEM